MAASGRKHLQVALCAFFIFNPTLAAPSRSAPVSNLPRLTLPNVRGGNFSLRVQPAQPLLLAFLQTFPDSAPTPSHSQAVFLASMAHQYGPRGLRVAIVDASVLAPATALSSAAEPARGSSSAPVKQPSRDAVLNASYDWHLEFPLLFDQKGQLARALQVNEVPTTFLVATDGTIVQRWQGLTRPAVLAQGIERLLGGPLGRMP
jgi:hypothetical protein